MTPSKNWGRQKSWPPEGKIENKIVDEDKLKTKLESMNMNELRAYAKKHKLEAKDTDRLELIKEILEEVQ